MKEKRYFCDWWDQNSKRIIIIIAVIAAFTTFVLCLVWGGFNNFDYPEELYKELEIAYIPYVHEGSGIDLVGLKKAVHSLKEPIIYDDVVKLIYSYDTASVTVTLDENYNTISVERSTQDAESHKREVIVVNISNYCIYSLVMFVIMIGIGLIFTYVPSEVHKWVDEKLSKRRKNKT